jgi:hypothetical protein
MGVAAFFMSDIIGLEGGNRDYVTNACASKY